MGQNQIKSPEEKMAGHVPNAVFFGYFCGIGLIIYGLVTWGSSSGLGIGWNIGMGLVLIGLSYGVFRRSRACAITLLGLMVVGTLSLLLSGQRTGLFIQLAALYFFARGVQGTFSGHQKAQPAPGVISASNP